MKTYELRGDNREFYRYKGLEAILSGPAETGKTLAALLKIHTLLSKYKGAQITILRKVRRDLYGSALITYRRDILGIGSFKEHVPGIKIYGGEKPEFVDYLQTGARLWIGGLDDPGKTLSSERDVIFVPQAEELSLPEWEYLLRCVTGRGAVMPYTQLLGDANPGPPTHWILRRSQIKHLVSKHKDNPTLWDGQRWTEQGKRTIEILSSFTGSRYKRLFQGLWAAPEGMIYDVFDEVLHTARPTEIPHNWPRVVGIDPFGDCVAAVWLALDPRGQVWHVYREYVQGFGETTEGHAANIRRLSAGQNIFYWCGGGPSERQARVDFNAAGVPLVAPASSDVWSQINNVYGMLKRNELVIHDTCPQLISEIGEYHRPSKNGVVQDGKIDDKGAYHVLDALRYGVTGPQAGDRYEVGTMHRRIG